MGWDKSEVLLPMSSMSVSRSSTLFKDQASRSKPAHFQARSRRSRRVVSVAGKRYQRGCDCSSSAGKAMQD